MQRCCWLWLWLAEEAEEEAQTWDKTLMPCCDAA